MQKWTKNKGDALLHEFVRSDCLFIENNELFVKSVPIYSSNRTLWLNNWDMHF